MEPWIDRCLFPFSEDAAAVQTGRALRRYTQKHEKDWPWDPDNQMMDSVLLGDQY